MAQGGHCLSKIEEKRERKTRLAAAQVVQAALGGGKTGSLGATGGWARGWARGWTQHTLQIRCCCTRKGQAAQRAQTPGFPRKWLLRNCIACWNL
eukprot:232160-Pelagomonas_calceolata.AAC.1